MCTAGCIKGNLTLAEGALLGGGSSGSGLLLSDLEESHNALQQEEEDERGQNEVDDSGNEGCEARAKGVNPTGPVPGEKRGQKGLNEIGGQSGYDRGKGAADDDADCHIQYVSAQGEFFKIFKKLFHENLPFIGSICVILS